MHGKDVICDYTHLVLCWFGVCVGYKVTYIIKRILKEINKTLLS